MKKLISDIQILLSSNGLNKENQKQFNEFFKVPKDFLVPKTGKPLEIIELPVCGLVTIGFPQITN